jgi:hypothetical protein
VVEEKRRLQDLFSDQMVMEKGEGKYFCGRVFEIGDDVRVNGRVRGHAAMRRCDERSFCGNLIRKDLVTTWLEKEVLVFLMAKCVFGHRNNTTAMNVSMCPVSGKWHHLDAGCTVHVSEIPFRL